MKIFKKHRGSVGVLDRSNIDTDQIIAKQFLKSIARTGFGPQLFYDWRYKADGKPNADFSLNAPRFQGASILVAGNNFGCGSSREHAVWALAQYGFEVIVAPRNRQADGSVIPGFADIFKNNCSKNSVLTIELDLTDYQKLVKAIDELKEKVEATADVENQTIVFHIPGQEMSFKFEMDPSVRDRFLNGLDDIGITLKNGDALAKFELQHDPQIARHG